MPKRKPGKDSRPRIKKSRSDPSVPRQGSGRFTPEQVRDTLTNPIYAYGLNLQPYEKASEQVLALDRQIAEEVRRSGRAPSVDELDQRFQRLFQQLIDESTCVRGPDAEALLSKEKWLQSQLTRITRLVSSEDS